MVEGTARGASRWYRVAAERCYIQIRVDDGMRTWESRRVVVVFGPGRSFWCPIRAYIRAVRLYMPRQHCGRELTDEGSYSKQRVAPKPSSRHAILSFHNERVPSRSVSRRNFNTLVYLTNPFPTPPFFSLPLPPRIFAPSRILFFFFYFSYFVYFFFLFLTLTSLAYSSDAFSSFAPTCSFFRWVSSGSPDIPRGELVRRSQNRFFVFPRYEREDREDTLRLWDWNREFIVS